MFLALHQLEGPDLLISLVLGKFVRIVIIRDLGEREGRDTHDIIVSRIIDIIFFFICLVTRSLSFL